MAETRRAETKIAVVMAGGKGTRFWPRSRANRPKQFLAIAGEETLLHQTVARLHGAFRPEHIFVVTTRELAEECQRMLPELPPDHIVIEPEGRNTAPCLALALVQIERKIEHGVMIVLSADHWIGDTELFLEDIETAVKHAAWEHDLVTFGIRPSYPETGYGYIEASGHGAVQKVLAFREKPPLDVAIQYLQSGHHFWNAGMFVWSLQDFREALERYCPEVLAPLDAWTTAGAEAERLGEAYALLPEVAIDVALMEKAAGVAVVPARFQWSDVGSWPAAIEFHEADGAGNVIQGQAVVVDSKNCAVFGGRRMIALSGVEDLIIVDDEDALLVCHRDQAQGVKTIVGRLKALGREDLL